MSGLESLDIASHFELRWQQTKSTLTNEHLNKKTTDKQKLKKSKTKQTNKHIDTPTHYDYMAVSSYYQYDQYRCDLIPNSICWLTP